jgi:hypothetical protein
MTAELAEQLAQLSPEELALLRWKLAWNKTARPKQKAPVGSWSTWGIMAGRGFGKTVTGSNWLGIAAASDPGSFNAVIAPTLDDVRYTCFEGTTGLLAYLPDNLVADYNKSALIIYLTNGAVIRGFGSERPERLRGPQHSRVWGDEVAAWQNMRMTYDMMKFGLRLGPNPQFVWTTTPKPLPLIRELVDAADGKKTLVTYGTTYENKANLAQSFYDDIAKYEGTKIGRQELEGILIDPEEGGIVKRSQWKLWPAKKPLPRFIHIIMSLDTAYTEKTFDKKTHEADPTACEVWGLFQVGKQLHVMMLDAWDDYLALPALMKRVREERVVTYGEADRPLINSALIPSPYSSAEYGVQTGKAIDLILVEDKGSGISLRQMMQMENVLMEKYNPGRADKLARLHAITPMFSHGRVWAVESDKRPGEFRSWADKAIGQICSFFGPGTTENDDYVDTCSQALNYFMRRFITTFSKPTEDEQIELDLKGREEETLRPRGNPYAA